MKGYKVFNSDWTFHKKQYSCPGIFEQEGKLELGKNGIHFCKNLNDCFNYYGFYLGNKVAEVEAIGEIIVDTETKRYCTSKIKIIKELSWCEVLGLVNVEKNNTRFENHGDYNSSDYNTGNYNYGSCNTGMNNIGIFNSGDYNVGNYMILTKVIEILDVLTQ